MANTPKVGDRITATLKHPEGQYTITGIVTKVAKGIDLVQANFDNLGIGWIKIMEVHNITKV